MDKEMVIVAGRNKADVGRIRHFLREQRCHSFPCKSAGEIIQELKIFPSCGVKVTLVVITSDLLGFMGDDVEQLSGCALDVPFVLFDGNQLSADEKNIFERICTKRIKFEPQHNFLADILEQAGSALLC